MKKCLFLALVLLAFATTGRAEMRPDGLLIPKALFEKMGFISRELREANGKLATLITKRLADLERKPNGSKAARLTREELADLERTLEKADKERRELAMELQKLKAEAGLADIE